MDATTAKQLRRLRTLGRGASGAVVWLASDDASGQLLAVKSAGAGAAETLRREGRVMAGLCSPHIVPCLGSRVAAGGEYQLFLEFAPRGSLADEAARSGGNLAERAIQGYAADVARGLAYLHGNSLVHGDVKARNVMVGADGRAKLADFGCARAADSDRTIGGTPAFMAPEVARGEEQGLPAEVARGEEQGLAADVWALSCTVIEMATGRAPWSDMDDVFAAVHRIGYTDAVPELPESLSPQAKDFLIKCLERNPRHRSIHCRAAPRAPVSGVRLPRRRRGAGEAGLDVPQEHTQRGILGVGRGKRNRGHANERGREDRLAGEPLQGFARLGLRRWLDRRARRTLRSFRNNDGHGDRRHRFRSLE